MIKVVVRGAYFIEHAPEHIGKYFDNLEEVMKRNDFGPHQVYNIDEAGVTTVHQPGNVIAGCGVKQVGEVTSPERGTLVTLCCAVNAIGNSVPPMFIFPMVYFREPRFNAAPIGSKGVAHPIGWMMSDLLAQYLKHFVSHINLFSYFLTTMRATIHLNPLPMQKMALY